MNTLRNRLLDLLADLEAGLDFVDEDIEFVSADDARQRLEDAELAVTQLLSQMSDRAISHDAVRVVLVGCANVGKSSLLNALAAESAALVADVPGTTRDYLVRRFEHDGMTYDLVDTAGVAARPAPDALDRAAHEMTRQEWERAHLQLLCLDSTRPLNLWERDLLQTPLDRRLLVLTKVDAPRRTDLTERAIETSSVTGRGLDTLRQEIVAKVAGMSAHELCVVAETAARCRDSLRRAQQCLRGARDLSIAQAGEELVASELRAALDELGQVVGAVYTDDILDRVFSRFCIGK